MHFTRVVPGVRPLTEKAAVLRSSSESATAPAATELPELPVFAVNAAPARLSTSPALIEIPTAASNPPGRRRNHRMIRARRRCAGATRRPTPHHLPNPDTLPPPRRYGRRRHEA